MLYKDEVIKIWDEPTPRISMKKAHWGREDILKSVEKRMWKDKPLWDYGGGAGGPRYESVMPQDVKEMYRRKSEKAEKKFMLRKS